MLSDSEIDKRFPIWEAMSDLFLDTELGETDHKCIAKVVLASEYSPEEVNSILWNEVLLGVGDNLRCIAGEWAGFNPIWLKDRILAVISSEEKTLGEGGILSAETLIKITTKEWLKVCAYLPSEYGEAMQPPRSSFPRRSKGWWNLWQST